MAARKLVRDSLIGRQPLIRQLLLAQPKRVCGGAPANGFTSRRQFSLFSDISKKVMGELESNPEIKKTVNELKKEIKQTAEGLKGVKQDMEARTKQSTEQLLKVVDGVRTEAESTAKKVYSNVEEKIAATKTEVKDSFGLGKQESSEFSGASEKVGAESKFAEGKKPDQHQQSGSDNYVESVLGMIKAGAGYVSGGASTVFQKVKGAKPVDAVKKGYDFVKEELNGNANRRRHLEHARPTSSVKVEKSNRTELVYQPQSKMRTKMDDFMDKLRSTPAYKRVRKLSEPVQDIADNVRDWYETTDSPLVHKVQNATDTVFGETDVGTSTKEIKQRDPAFSLPEFVADVQEWVKPVLNAYFKGNTDTLNTYCTKEVIERCKAEHQVFASQNLFFDHKILHISEVDVREVKMLEDSPVIIVSFQTQQVNCLRDRHGMIKEGGKDTIHTVYYLWALQQILEEDALHPIWRLREMQQFGVQALI